MNTIRRREFLKLAGLGVAGLAVGRQSYAATEHSLALIEAENFQHPGGWVLDQQFMDQMGSPYLLAHGLGRPVADATTAVTLPGAAGTYRVWIRTCDWVAKWQAPGAPGKYLLLINGKPLETTFGTEGAAWHWQDGGMVVCDENVSLALRDLTGFESRCDAILFSRDINFRPPENEVGLMALRRQLSGLHDQPEDGGSYDLVVVGGGIAGVCAALTAARSGLKTALVHDRPVLGGNNSSEVRVWLGGEVQLQPYPHVGNIVAELEPKQRAHAGPANTAEIYEDSHRQKLLAAEDRLKTFLGQHLISTESQAGRLAAIVTQDLRTGRRIRLTGELFADCTGDGQMGFLAGADFEVSLKQHMGPSNLWHVYDIGVPAVFPRCAWALDLASKPFPGRASTNSKTGKTTKPNLENLGQWFWECGFDWDPIADAEKMRDWNLRAMYGAWDALKNTDGLFPSHQLHWASYITGKRESRRLLGDVVLSKDDIRHGNAFDDACFPCTWSIDLHYPEPRYQKGFEGREFISNCVQTKFKTPYWAPYRSLYSRNVPNLFMAGRDISVTHEALGTVRVMRTCGAMGEVVGLAAALCHRYSGTPRGIYEKHRDKLIAALQRGTPGQHTG